MRTLEESTRSEIQERKIELLGNLIKYPKRFEEFQNVLSPEHFDDLGFVYRKIVSTFKRDGEINSRTIAKELGIEYIQLYQAMRDNAVSDGRTEFLVQQIVKEKAKKEVIRIAEKLMLNVNSSDPVELIDQLKEHLESMMISDYRKLPDPLKDYIEFVEHVEKVKADPSITSGLMTSNIDLDAITNGWQRTDLIVIGGRTSMGKSAFALNNVLDLAKAGNRCAVFSLEMSKRQVYMRLAASAYGIPLYDFKTGGLSDETIMRLRKHDEFWNRIIIDDTRAVSADYIAETMQQIKQQIGLDFVVVDYLQDVKETGEHTDNTGSALNRVCRKLRKAAQDCNVPIMAMSQISRDVEKRNADKRPSNSDLSGSTGIETSADVIGLLYRDDYYNPETAEPNVLELNITKHRNGATGQVKFFYDKTTQCIRPYQRTSTEPSRTYEASQYIKKNNGRRFIRDHDD